MTSAHADLVGEGTYLTKNQGGRRDHSGGEVPEGPRAERGAEVAERLGTSVRFPLRLIAEQRIRYVKVGRHVRIPERVVDEWIAASTVEALE